MSGQSDIAATSILKLIHSSINLRETGTPMAKAVFARDSAEVDALIASYFAEKHHAVVKDPKKTFAYDELPLARIKRIMKQDSFVPGLPGEQRQVCADAVPFMAFAAQLFIGHVTKLAWTTSTKHAKRNTLLLKDLQEAVFCSSKFDFLIDVVDKFEEDRQQSEQGNGRAPAQTLPLRRAPAPMPAQPAMQPSHSLPNFNSASGPSGLSAMEWDDEDPLQAQAPLSKSAPAAVNLHEPLEDPDLQLLDFLLDEDGSIEFSFIE